MTSLDKFLETAIMHHTSGEYQAAEHAYKEILASNPRHDGALHLLGVIAYQAGRSDEGINLIQRAIEINGKVAVYFNNLGLVFQQKKRFAEAIAAHRKAISLQPNLASAHSNLGLALQLAGRHDESVHSFQAAIKIEPKFAAAHFNLAIALSSLGRQDEAIGEYETAVRLQPSYWEAYANLAISLKSIGQYDKAVHAYRSSIGIRPHIAETHFGLANALKEMGNYEEAITAYEAALAVNPTYAECLNNMASVLVNSGRLREAVEVFSKAIALKGDFPVAKYNLSLALLRLGEYDAGWPLYEARASVAENGLESRDYAQPRWAGEALQGKTILLYFEQGLGDTIQFSRFAALVAARGAHVVLEVPKKMLKLFSGLEGIHQLIASGDILPSFDFHCSLMSLAGVLGITLNTIPSRPSYLGHEERRRAHWKQYLGSHGFKIGIVWQGNPSSPSERGRSAPLASVVALANIPGVRLISLQKVDGLEQIKQLASGVTVETLGTDFDSGPDAFVDTAAVMLELDLIISVDTSILHLAGALGRPTWLALQAVPHWVWLMDRSDTPWYPSVRLFRQDSRGDWAGVFLRMCEALTKEPRYLEKFPEEGSS
jgi:tetratricopeptide (TPR) repeat protein